MKSIDLTKVPLEPDTSAFTDRPLLIDLCNCWLDARAKKMLPTKWEFEKQALNHPAILPNLALVEFKSPTEFHYRYIGSARVQRRGEDQTRQNVTQAFAPNAREFLTSWTLAGFELPHMTLWTDRTALPSGAIAESTNLSVVMTGESGLPNCLAVVTDVAEAYTQELAGGNYLIGSKGMEVVPIDIGMGIPDLPRKSG